MTLWLVRAGKHGDQEQGAYNGKVVTIGWNELPDLSNIKSEERLKVLYSKIYPEEKKKTPAEQAGIKLDLDQNKIESLIKLASKKFYNITKIILDLN